jgi:Tat protein translocase TatB subunit
VLDIGFQEILVIMALALIVFGPERLPELGRRLGRAMREFRRASDEFRSTIETNLQLNETILPASSPLPSASATELPSEAGAPADTALGGASATEPAPEGETAVSGPAEDGATDAAGEGGEPLEPFWARRGSRLLHRRSCAWRSRVPDTDRVGLKTATDGWDMGLLPCPVCEPREAMAGS